MTFYDEQLADLDTVDKEHRVRIETMHEMRHPLLREAGREELRALRPVPEVERRVRETWSQGLGGVPYIAMMIRAHKASHRITLQRSPLEWYLGRMQDLADRFPGTPFFLSTDSPEAEETVRHRFDGIVVQRDKGDYNSAVGLQAAVADLYLLASASFVLQPYWSSFPAMARALADPRVQFVHALSENDFAGAPSDLPPPADPLRPFTRE